MKTEIIEKDKGIYYPCIMKSKESGMILLVVGKDGTYTHGTVLDPGESKYKIGYYNSCWDSKLFELFRGKIVLSNDI